MFGQMMQMPLTISAVLDFAAKYHGEVEIVSRMVEGPLHRYDYATMASRARRLANALSRLGIARGERVATLAWNTHRHVEAYFAISSMGAVCHTINPRLFAEQLAYVVNHAEDRLLFVDLTFVPMLEKLADQLPTVRGYVVMANREHMPVSTLPNILCYEDLLAAAEDFFPWPEFDENTAASLCYTSGTTGDPKGVLYSHRSTVLHAMTMIYPDVLGLSACDALLPVVPMFHVNAWGLPYSAAMTGAKLVLPGPRLDGASLAALIRDEAVTVTAGVPTVWFNLLNHLDQSGDTLGALELVVTGGSTCPAWMFDAFNRHGVRIVHAWGMTETSPLGTANASTRATMRMSYDQQRAIQLKQGRPPFGMDLKIVDGENRPLPHDGAASGALKVRGPWVCDGYFRHEGSQAHAEPGWFDTGDIATIDSLGYVQIVDRAKDVIKTGGEWISSIDLENVALGHPAVREAAAIARPHAKWGERPVVIVVLKPDAEAAPAEIRAFFEGKVGKCFEPDEVIITDALPYNATGKVMKAELRMRYAGA